MFFPQLALLGLWFFNSQHDSDLRFGQAPRRRRPLLPQSSWVFICQRRIPSSLKIWTWRWVVGWNVKWLKCAPRRLKSAKREKFHFVQLWWNMRWIKIGCKIHTSTPTTKSWSSQIANVLNGDPFWSLHVVTLTRRWRSQTPCCPDVCLVAMWRGISSTDKMTSFMARDIRDIRVLPRGRNTSEMS